MQSNVGVIADRLLNHQKSLFSRFIDCKKTFDRVQHQKMLDVMDCIGIDDKLEDLRIVQKVYWHQTASVRVNGEETEESSMSKWA